MALSRINTNQIVDGAVATADIADGLITTAKLADGAVTTAKVGADAVTSAKIADDAINSEHYTDGSVDTAHITDANITTAKLADDAVTTAKVADDAVTQAKIGADAVGTNELANDVAISTSGDVTTTGNVTVNTALKLRGDTGTLHFRRTTSEADIAKIEYVNSNPSFDISANGKNIRFTNASSHGENMRLTSSGNLGIGNTNPSHTLDLKASAPELMLEETSSGGSKRIGLGVESDGTPFISAEQSGGQIEVQLSGNNEFLFFNSGRFKVTRSGVRAVIGRGPVTGVNVDNGSTTTVAGYNGVLFNMVMVSTGGGFGAVYSMAYNSTVNMIHGTGNFSATQNTSSSTNVYKSSGSHAVTLQNNTGSAVSYFILILSSYD